MSKNETESSKLVTLKINKDIHKDLLRFKVENECTSNASAIKLLLAKSL